MSQKVNPSVSEKTITFEMNGKTMHLSVDPARRLIDILRYDLDLTGTKMSCEIGRCGACMVLIDGKTYNSCLTMAYQCEGKKVVTIEGVNADEVDPILQAFLEEGGFQCGYCTPGMVISIKALLKEHPHPTVEQLKEGLAGNLCRCTGYGGIYRVLERLSRTEPV
ncbi:2Fe-2S iron-sulfur cluster binding domain-containing protein [Halalkalibacterium halodurans]|uniref:2Fe-2S iron-sulfur cluster-binding protein n=1 Tax=Halalkalibacterium halodurans TaxID=86665 RepID=UPI0010680614|nr:2Fe-2S iron-sulfur cluster-binding protein [Halalkalibacterium halodurans]TES54151.1 2Fe-2S iron-sulfur cluster binding domain-containing protein [Halalkalibacterium halodurans]